MAQFDVHRSPGRNRVAVPLVLVVQTRVLDHLSTRLVSPLMASHNFTHRGVYATPVFDIEGQRVVLAPWQIQTVRADQLGPVIASLADDVSTSAIINAIDAVIARAYGWAHEPGSMP
jgi:toxin CcdB